MDTSTGRYDFQHVQSARGYSWAIRESRHESAIEVWEMGPNGETRQVATIRFRPVAGDNRPQLAASRRAVVEAAKRALQVMVMPVAEVA